MSCVSPTSAQLHEDEYRRSDVVSEACLRVVDFHSRGAFSSLPEESLGHLSVCSAYLEVALYIVLRTDRHRMTILENRMVQLRAVKERKTRSKPKSGLQRRVRAAVTRKEQRRRLEAETSH